MVDPVLIDWSSALCFKGGWGFSQNADKAQDEMWTLSEYYSQPRNRHFPIAYQQRPNFARPVGNMALTLSIASELSISRVIIFQWGFWQRYGTSTKKHQQCPHNIVRAEKSRGRDEGWTMDSLRSHRQYFYASNKFNIWNLRSKRPLPPLPVMIWNIKASNLPWFKRCNSKRNLQTEIYWS